ncbi:MAG: DNA photolyase [SAR86 cluster bacterium]|uniref:DNA photolyase n=1 Tax=SAR86 cluster bacterium TaxID=2030880 RepID=A0A2A5B0Z3_9GAMM|nr:MAG: DNA photolyase [SAR86 cluster bacterium]
MFSAIYIEEEVANTERVDRILSRFSGIPQIRCERYGEIFNRKAQNFRLQKKSPALILARKHGKLVLPAPEGYGFDSGPGYYFSHMLNCVYDCRYCFLQGMYDSANYVLFTNYQDFETALSETIAENGGSGAYYSGYDCDSLALEPVSNFCEYFIPVFARHPEATLEIRTKSTQIRTLLEMPPITNCIIAMSFTAREASDQWEHKVPSITKRIEALYKLQQAGWKIAIRFEPVIFDQGFEEAYQKLFRDVFDKLDVSALHSVSIGLFRMPADFYKRIVKLYPDEPLFARPIASSGGMMSLRCEKESENVEIIEKMLFEFISRRQYYRCA